MKLSRKLFIFLLHDIIVEGEDAKTFVLGEGGGETHTKGGKEKVFLKKNLVTALITNNFSIISEVGKV